MKRAISLLLAMCFMVSCLLLPANAESSASSSISYFIDNDTSDTANCYNNRNGYAAYISDSDYYNGDLRRTYSYSSSDSYAWMRKTAFSNSIKNNPIHMSVGVYLKSTVLSDTAASYWCVQSDGGYIMFYVNQATNANGWSYYTYTLNTNHSTPGWYSLKGIEVHPSGTGSGYSAADAIYVYASNAH
ncbi:MAG: hypothetical protein ACI3VE_03260 [Oscillospiraceae bacterium]